MRVRSFFVSVVVGLCGAVDATATTAPEGASPLQIEEIHYHPAARARGSEFIEVRNVSETTVDASGWSFDDGVRFVFPPGAKIGAGARVVICRHVELFRAAFGKKTPREAEASLGVFEGSLDNAGERLRLRSPAGKFVTDVIYGDVHPWPTAADGDGHSLQRIDVMRDVDDPSNWRAAPPTPGVAPAPVGLPGSRAPRISLYDARHEPRAPTSKDRVRISVRRFARDDTNDGDGVVLHYTAGALPQRLPMVRVTGANSRSRDEVFSATVDAQEAGTIVRYWMSVPAAGSSGVDVRADRARLPATNAPTQAFGFHVGSEADADPLPVFDLWLDGTAERALSRRPFGNQLYDATFAYGGAVYDVKVRRRGHYARYWPKKSWKIFLSDDRRFGKRRRR